MHKYKLKLLSFIILPLLAMPQPVNTNAEIREPQQWVNPQPIEVIKKYADEYTVDGNLVYSNLYCESLVNPQTKAGDNGQSKGIAQIKDPTWEYLEGKLGEELDKNSYHDAIKLTAFAFSINEGKHWTAYRAIKNGGSYTFTNVHTGKEQTVYCKYQNIPVK